MRAAPAKSRKTRHVIVFAALMTIITLSYACTEPGRDNTNQATPTPTPTPKINELLRLLLKFRGDEPPIIVSGGSVELDIDRYEYDAPVAAPSPTVKFVTSRDTQIEAVAVFNDDVDDEKPALCTPPPATPRILKITYKRGLFGPTSVMRVRDNTQGCPTGITSCVTVEFDGNVLGERARMRRRRFNRHFRITKVEFVNQNEPEETLVTCYPSDLVKGRITVAIYNTVPPQ